MMDHRLRIVFVGLLAQKNTLICQIIGFYESNIFISNLRLEVILFFLNEGSQTQNSICGTINSKKLH